MSGLFGSKTVVQAPTTPTPPPNMPDPASPEVLEARRKAMATVGGRQSTILSTASSRAGDTLAGSAGARTLGNG